MEYVGHVGRHLHFVFLSNLIHIKHCKHSDRSGRIYNLLGIYPVHCTTSDMHSVGI